MPNKRGQGLPLTVIVVAVILIIVLVLLLYTFKKGGSLFSESLSDCESKDGFCAVKCNSDVYAESAIGCSDKNVPSCCIKVSEENPKSKIIEGDLPI